VETIETIRYRSDRLLFAHILLIQEVNSQRNAIGDAPSRMRSPTVSRFRSALFQDAGSTPDLSLRGGVRSGSRKRGVVSNIRKPASINVRLFFPSAK